MNTQTKPSELEVAARVFVDIIESRKQPFFNVPIAVPYYALLKALNENKPAPLPDAVVELIEHCGTKPTISSLDANQVEHCFSWIDECRSFAERAKPHLSVELKPCPFCQGTDLEAVSTHGVTNICCRNSECAIHHVNCSIDKWQQRGETPA